MSTPQDSALPLSHCLAYAGPYFSATWIVAPIATVQGIYAKHYGLALTTIALVLLISRIFDAVTDPLIGYWSDRYYQRTGTRKPFILVGGLLLMICAWFLYVPPADVGAGYFTFWFMALYLGLTLFEVPHITWGGELAGDATAKNRVYSVRSMVGYAGLISFYAIPLLPLFDSSAITPQVLKVSVSLAAGLMAVLLLYCLKVVPDAPRVSLPVKPTPAGRGGWQSLQSLQALVCALMGNRPFVLFLLAYCLCHMGISMWYGLVFIFVDIYLGLGEQFAGMFMVAFAAGIVVTPLWYRVANRIGKQRTWVVAMLLFLFSFGYTATLAPGETSFSQLLILKVVQTIGYSAIGLLVPAMLSEICDYGTWKFGVARSGLYFSVYMFLQKSVGALAMSLGLAIAGWYGFDAMAGEQTEAGVQGLLLAMTWVPLVFSVLALLLVVRLPITTRRHAIIQRRLTANRRRQEKMMPDETKHSGASELACTP